MANPYLVIGGIAVGIAVAAMGILQVPGWVKSAQDASAINDLANVAIGEALGSTMGIGYMTGEELNAGADDLGMSFTPSKDVQMCVTRSDDRSSFAAVAISPSGAFFARTADANKALEGTTAEEALDLIGGLPAGVPAPVIDGECAPGAEVPGSAGPGNPGGPDGPGGPGTPGPGNPGSGGGGPAAGPLGPEKLGLPSSIAWTENGVFLSGLGGGLATGPGDGKSYGVAFTGEATEPGWSIHDGVQSDRAGNLYVKAYRDTGDALFKVTDGWYTTQVTDERDVWQYTVSPDGTVYFTEWNGTVNKMTGFDTFETVASVHLSNWDTKTAVTDDGTFYMMEDAWQNNDYAFRLHIGTPDGGVTSRIITDPATGGQVDRYSALTVGVDGTIYLATPTMLASVAVDGTLTPILTSATIPELSNGFASAAVDFEGNIYTNDRDGVVYRVDAATGAATPWMPHGFPVIFE